MRGVSQAVGQARGDSSDGQPVGRATANRVVLTAFLGQQWVEQVVGQGTVALACQAGSVLRVDLPRPGLVIDAGVLVAEDGVAKATTYGFKERLGFELEDDEYIAFVGQGPFVLVECLARLLQVG